MDMIDKLRQDIVKITTDHKDKMDTVMSQLAIVAPFFGLTAHDAFYALENEKVKRELGLDVFRRVNRRDK